MNSFSVHNVAGEAFHFYADKAVYWPRRSTLLVADLHLGKTEVFQRAGIAVSSDLMLEDLARLTSLVKHSSAERLIVLGDLLHAPTKLPAATIEAVHDWRGTLGIEIGVVLGNHDRRFTNIPKSWAMSDLGEVYYQDGFAFRHEPLASPHHHVWAGHVHPMLKMSGGPDRLRLPCFWFREGMTLLPSFSLFTRGVNIELSKCEYAMIAHKEGLFQVGPA